MAKVSLKSSNKQVACDDGECFYKNMKRFRGIENKKCRFTNNISNWVYHRNNNLRYCSWNRKYKRSNSVRWFTELSYNSRKDSKGSPYLNLSGAFVMREWKPDYSLTLELFNTAGNYDQFYVSD